MRWILTKHKNTNRIQGMSCVARLLKFLYARLVTSYVGFKKTYIFLMMMKLIIDAESICDLKNLAIPTRLLQLADNDQWAIQGLHK